MTVSLTTRLGIHRWSTDADPWDREHFDSDNAALEELAVIGTQGLNASRPAAGVQRRLYLATDTERVYLDDGDEWYELAVLGTANTWAAAQTFNGNVAVGGSLTVAGTAVTLATDLAAHVDDTTGAHAASAISLTPTGDVAATDVQGAIAELASEKATASALSAHTGAAAGAHAATAISYAGSTDLSSTTVEAALDELDTEKAPKASPSFTGTATFGGAVNIDGNVTLTTAGGTITGGSAVLTLDDTTGAQMAYGANSKVVLTGASGYVNTPGGFSILAAGATKVEATATGLGFFGATPVARPGTYNLTGSADRTLGAYASDPETSAYTGSPADAAATAKLADLNALRAAYENLRVYVEDLAGIVIGTATDLKTLGLVG